MKIHEVKTARKVGRFVLRQDGSPNLIRFERDPSFPESEFRARIPRVYLLVVDDEIYKIGGSSDRNGLRGTLSFYANARTGSPGPSRFIMHGLIANKLREGKEVSVWVITSPRVRAQICGLFKCEEGEVTPYKEMEQKCLEDYRAREGKFPPWNFQENRDDYPRDLYQEYLDYHDRRINR
ncbi:hypothetical protein [Thermus sp.]|jgi:hypothetical protein|uniref:hypothetical protein n=1 Tax=Thermus sp. TaxID=275 RepID=UPI0032205D94